MDGYKQFVTIEIDLICFKLSYFSIRKVSNLLAKLYYKCIWSNWSPIRVCKTTNVKRPLVKLITRFGLILRRICIGFVGICTFQCGKCLRVVWWTCWQKKIKHFQCDVTWGLNQFDFDNTSEKDVKLKNIIFILFNTRCFDYARYLA